MDKVTLENYEFLSTADENSQFILVQDDGTYLINKTEGQFVSQEEGEQCVFDVSQSHFLVDGNPTNLVPVPEGFVIHESSTSTREVFKAEIESEDNQKEELQQNHCTEITLSDDQYQLLQKNGWVLLETNDKIWMLDSTGIQDITSDHELIEQLKALLVQNGTNGEIKATSSRSVLRTDFTQPLVDLENCEVYGETQNQDTIELVFDSDSVQLDTARESQTEEPEDQSTADIVVDGTQLTQFEEPHSNITTKPTVVHSGTKPRHLPKLLRNQRHIRNERRPPLCNPLKLKTEYFFKDIPNKIYLGKTVNGKNLVARVKTIITNQYSKPVNIVPETYNSYSRRENDVKNNRGNEAENIMSENKCVIEPHSKTKSEPLSQTRWYNATHVKKLPVYTRGRSSKVWSSGDDDCGAAMYNRAITDASNIDDPSKDGHKAEAVVARLIGMPSLISMIQDANLVITKTLRCGESPTSTESYILTGSISIGDDKNPKFRYIPGMIKKLSKQNKDVTDSFSVYHIHITETQYEDQDDAICITLNEKFISTNMDFACDTCTKTYTTAEALDRHQETHEIDSEDTLTIDDPEKDCNVSETFQDEKIKQEDSG